MADPAPVRGSTRVAAVIGHPIRHSLSPAILNAAFAACELDWVYAAFDVPEGGAPGAVAAVRALDLGGLSVTMPHKAAVIPALDRLSPTAEALGAVNCIAWDGSALVGHSTDGPGFLDALAADAGWSAEGRRCVVLGAGGAARAIVRALAGAGAREVAVVNRTAERAEAAAALAGAAGRVATEDAAGDADLVVNATSVGMGAGLADEGPYPVDPARLGPGQVVVDVVYQPVLTPLLRAATAQGATAVDGVGMLVHQAAHAFTTWTGEPAPVDAMRAAAGQALGGIRPKA